MGPMGSLQSVPNISLPWAVKFGPPLPPTFSLQHPHTRTQTYLSIHYVLHPEPPQRILSGLWTPPARKAPDSLPSHLLTPTNSRSLSTLDLAEQLADVGDSLQIRPRGSDHGILNQPAPRLGRVHFPHRPSCNLRAVVDKASIKIPFPPPRHISRLERLLSAMMSSRNRQASQLHGLVGKPLL